MTGYGTCETSNDDVRRSAYGLSELPEGQRVRMQISQGQKGPEARSIEILD